MEFDRKILKMKLFRLLLAGLCKIFRYGGVIYNVSWLINFGGLVVDDKKVIAMNNLIKEKGLKARLRPMTKNDPVLEDFKKGGQNGLLP